MKKLVFLISLLVFTACKKEKNNEETVVEKTTSETKEGTEWTSLFDGKTFNGWHLYLTDDLPNDEWTIEDGAMFFSPKKDRKEIGKNIISNKDYTNFKLSLEWKVSKESNSGVFWGVKEDAKFIEPYETGPEIQVLDNVNYLDKNPKHQAGALFDIIAPKKDVTNPVGEWNSFVIYINHKTNKGKVWLNDVLIMEFPVHGEEWRAIVDNSKFKNWKGFGKFTTGKLGLQDHGNKVWYRNIKIQEL